MSYIDYIRALDEYLETNSLSPEAQLIYYKLLSLFNKARWPESIQVDNERLQAMCGVDADRSFRRHRDKLVEAGFVQFIKGRPGSPNRYTLPGYKAPPAPQPEEPAPAPAPKKKPAKKSAPKKSAPVVFVPPTKDEVVEYCRSRVSPVDPNYFWEYFNASGWVDSKGNAVQNWKSKLVTWERFTAPSQSVNYDEPCRPPQEPKGHLVTRVDAFGRKRTVWVEDD
jgi:hypothetical protein